MKQGGWPSLVCTYSFGVLGVASIAKFIPLRLDFQHFLGATPAEFGWLIALLGIPAAFLAALSGAVVDRVGPRASLCFSGCVGVVADAGYYFAPTLRLFQVVRLLEGVALVGIFTAGPALLMATTDGRRRVVAMTFWSTYTPTGFSIGLLLGGAFAGTANWRLTFAAHGVLLLLAATGALQLPRIAPVRTVVSARRRLEGLAAAYRNRPALQLAVVFFLIISIGFGTNTIFPSYFARVHSLGPAAASKLIAGATLMMIPGAFLSGFLLTREVRPAVIMLGLALGATTCGVALFDPSTSLGTTVPILCLWFLFMGGGPALLMAVLPQVAPPQQRASTAGLFNQASAIATFVNPPLWLSLLAAGGWLPFALLVTLGWSGGVLLLWLLPIQTGTLETPLTGEKL